MARTIIRIFVAAAAMALVAGCAPLPPDKPKPPAFRDFSPPSEP